MPERLGDYRLVEPLGRGGMGVVYRAWHTRLGQVRALKVLRPDRAGDRRAIERFQREITTLGGLEHPNLVRAFDAREEAGVIFLVMEFIEGLDLWRLLARTGPLPVSASCEVVRQAAIGLEYAYRTRGMVHRDIKPSNLMITPDGVVKVLDLGIAVLTRPPRRRWIRASPPDRRRGADRHLRLHGTRAVVNEPRRGYPHGCLRAGMHPLRAPVWSRALCRLGMGEPPGEDVGPRAGRTNTDPRVAPRGTGCTCRRPRADAG